MNRVRWGEVSLLLVIGGFCYAVLAPVFRSAREAPHEPSCLSKRKSQGTALLMYTQDFDGYFPSRSNHWMNQVLPYFGNGSGFRCSSLKKSEYGTAFDSRLAGKSSATLADPENSIAIFESTNRAKNATSPGTGFSTRHNGFGNVWFADGHAKALNREAFETLPAPRWQESGGAGAKKAAEGAKR